MLFLYYLWDRRRVIIGSLLLAAAAAGLFWLYRLPSIPLFYCFLVVGVLACGLFGLPDFVRYCRSARRCQALRNMAPHLTHPVGPPRLAEPFSQQMLLESIELLRQYALELEQQQAGRQEELLEYYTLWAHQIKTPLSAMGLILQSDPEDTGALRQELFKTERYVELVLGYLRIHSMNADLQLGLCPVRPIAARAAKKFAAQFIYKGLRLELDNFENRVVTDEKWLLFVLEQVISNAVKYTSTGTISITMDESDVLAVRDQGVGIDPSDLPRIFERGFTGRNGRLNETSTGLGLYLIRQVLDKLGNRVEVCSAPGKGTEVCLYLGRPEAARD
ncbi:sensor histidine kinase [Acutalibacter caecimuris]|uniref:sensor histidine kinase n=1 Tax=Acutalibacter caecimuris TaxID=3093657 RepID=UPI002AC8C3DF|nr:sensor histidine kinase [Acutalibacter sp. M00118]